jgi:hypothetical protein
MFVLRQPAFRRTGSHTIYETRFTAILSVEKPQIVGSFEKRKLNGTKNDSTSGSTCGKTGLTEKGLQQ